MGVYNKEHPGTYPETGYSPFIRDGKEFEWDSPATLAKMPKQELNANPDCQGHRIRDFDDHLSDSS